MHEQATLLKMTLAEYKKSLETDSMTNVLNNDSRNYVHGGVRHGHVEMIKNEDMKRKNKQVQDALKTQPNSMQKISAPKAKHFHHNHTDS